MPIIRPCEEQDVPAIAAIYAHHVVSGTGTFELTPPSVSEMLGRRTEVLAKGLPYLVAIDDKQLIGFAYCNWFKPRPAYRFSAEDSIYLAPSAQGRGIGRALLTELANRAEQTGVRKLIAVIGDSENLASIAVHRSVGFTMVGVLKSCGWKFDQWRDVILMDLPLGLSDTDVPR